MTPRYTGVRWREDVGFEMRCDQCATRHDGSPIYWPLTLEYWHPTAGMKRCRACWYVYWRQRQSAHRRRDPEYARARDRARYRANRRVLLIKRRAHYERNREAILAKARARYHERKAA